MPNEEYPELSTPERRCERCGLRGYYVENGLCLDCIEAEFRKNGNHLRGRLNIG